MRTRKHPRWLMAIWRSLDFWLIWFAAVFVLGTALAFILDARWILFVEMAALVAVAVAAMIKIGIRD